jgi:hypothetical protein
MPSFDVVSEINMQEVDNALNQARKEIEQRYDFKGSKTELALEKDAITINSSDEYKVKAAWDVLQTKLVRRSIDLKAVVAGKIEPAAGGRAKQTLTLQKGINADQAREIVKAIKETKLKVQAAIQADQVRISGKKRDDLQAAIQTLKQRDFGLPLQFSNYRE